MLYNNSKIYNKPDLHEGFIIYVSGAEQWTPLVALHPNICIAVDPKGGLDTEGQYLTDMAKDKS